MTTNTNNEMTTTDRTEDDQIVENMILLLGGKGRLCAMINARNFLKDIRPSEVSLHFTFSGSRKANRVRLTYVKGLDLYTLAILKFSGVEMKTVLHETGVYFDQVVPMIEKTTGLLLSL